VECTLPDFNVTSITGPSSKGQQFTRTREEPGDLHLHIFDKGPFAGRNHLEVATEAIRWWRSYLGPNRCARRA